MDYLDFGSSDSENEDDGEMACELDSDEDEQYENKRLMRMFNLHEPLSKEQRNIQDFEAEMEAELDRRALEIETKGGVEHQKSLSRSSSTNSLNKSPRASPVPGSSIGIKKSSLKRSHSNESGGSKLQKSVKFAQPVAGSLITSTSAQDQTISTEGASEKRAKEMYDELYFDSDESDGEGENRQKKEDKRRFLTNDELFYDPLSDDKDQEWMNNQRKKSYGESKQLANKSNSSLSSADNRLATKPVSNDITTNKNTAFLPSSDAILNCPACFTPVCNDCQRHELYVGQYRAMFVVNCSINKGETLTVPEKAPKKFRKKAKTRSGISHFTPSSCSDTFFPVLCNVCKTQVAMYDSEEVYHFFNVLASQP